MWQGTLLLAVCGFGLMPEVPAIPPLESVAPRLKCVKPGQTWAATWLSGSRYRFALVKDEAGTAEVDIDADRVEPAPKPSKNLTFGGTARRFYGMIVAPGGKVLYWGDLPSRSDHQYAFLPARTGVEGAVVGRWSPAWQAPGIWSAYPDRWLALVPFNDGLHVLAYRDGAPATVLDLPVDVKPLPGGRSYRAPYIRDRYDPAIITKPLPADLFECRVWPIGVTPDGSVLFTREDDWKASGDRFVWRISPPFGPHAVARKLLLPGTAGTDAYLFQLSPDGKRLAWLSQTPDLAPYRLWVGGADGTGAQPIAALSVASTPEMRQVEIQWAQDGGRLLVIANGDARLLPVSCFPRGSYGTARTPAAWHVLPRPDAGR